MKILYLSLLCFTQFTFSITDNIELTVSGAQQTKMPIILLIPHEKSKTLRKIVHTIKKDLLFVDQFQPSIATYDAHAPQKELREKIQKLAYAGIPLALFLSEPSQNTFEYHLYDTTQCLSLGSKRYKEKKMQICHIAHKIAHEARKALTGNNDIFSSKIAYCKKDIHKNSSKMYIADFDGSNEELIVNSATVIITPRWHTKHQELFYSEYTDTCMQLKSILIKGAKKPYAEKNISHFESGINMSVDYAPNGKDYVFCASKGGGSCQIYLYQDGKLKQCTNNSGNNDCPVYIDKDRICFSSNFQTGNPQIYIGNFATGHVQRITKGGYCTCPNYCAQTNQIIYHMMIQGIMQIMLYDCATKTHTQLTFDPGNKHNANWSPDGTSFLYIHEGSTNCSRLKNYNIITKRIHILSNDNCSYPSWSPSYL